MFPFNSLIEDLQKEILSYLDLKTLGRSASTSRQLEKIVKESPQWKEMGESILEEHAPRADEGRITNWFQFCKRCKILNTHLQFICSFTFEGQAFFPLLLVYSQ